MNSDRMFELAQTLAAAKSRQDVPAALVVLHDDMLLETPAFGTSAHGLAENEKVLTRFFTSFPDYNVVLEGHAANNDTLVCWGRVQMTMTGDRFGVVPNGRRAELPVFIQFAFRDDRIAASGSSSTCRSCAPNPASRPMRSGGGPSEMPPPGNRPRNDTFPVTQDFEHASRPTRQTRRRDQDVAIIRHRRRPQSKTEHR
jgi:predicted ester cyclase